MTLAESGPIRSGFLGHIIPGALVSHRHHFPFPLVNTSADFFFFFLLLFFFFERERLVRPPPPLSSMRATVCYLHNCVLCTYSLFIVHIYSRIVVGFYFSSTWYVCVKSQSVVDFVFLWLYCAVLYLYCNEEQYVLEKRG